MDDFVSTTVNRLTEPIRSARQPLRLSDIDFSFDPWLNSTPISETRSRQLALPTFTGGQGQDRTIINSTSERFNAAVLQQPRSPVQFQPTPKPPSFRGLGKSQNRKDIAELTNYVKAVLHPLVQNDLIWIYDGRCWGSYKGNAADVEIRRITDQIEDSEYIGDKELRSVRSRLLSDPDLQHPKEFRHPEGLLNLSDGTLDLFAMRFFEHRPGDEFTYFIDVSYADICNATEGAHFEQFAASIDDGSGKPRLQLLELLITTLLEYQTKHFYALLGESNTGKTQFCRFLQELVGRENVESVLGINDFAGRWTTGDIAGKVLVTCLDLPDAPLPKAAIGVIKQLVGDDSIKGERKYQQAFTYYNKPLLLLAGNHAIRVPQANKQEAFLNRLVIIPFVLRHEVDRIPNLYQKLLEEAPYIIREAISAFHELADRNFAVTRSEVPAEYQPYDSADAAAEVNRFVSQYFCYLQGQKVTTQSVWEHYDQLASCGSFKPIPRRSFNLALKSALLHMGAEIDEHADGRDARGYRNVQRLPVPVAFDSNNSNIL